MRISVALGAAVFCLACVGAAFAGGRVNVAGKWTAQAQGMVQHETCEVTLSSSTMFGQHQASSFGCSGALMHLNKWSVQGRKVVLSDAFGKVVAHLKLRGQRMVGRDAKGQRVELYRPGSGAGTSVAQSRNNGWTMFGGRRSRDRDCTVYADTGRCAHDADLRAPRRGSRIEMLAQKTNVRMFPDFDSGVVRAVKGGACFKVDECRKVEGARWCRVHRGHLSGYVVQTFTRQNETQLLFREGC